MTTATNTGDTTADRHLSHPVIACNSGMQWTELFVGLLDGAGGDSVLSLLKLDFFVHRNFYVTLSALRVW